MLSQLVENKKYEINSDGVFYYCDTSKSSDISVNKDFLMIIEEMCFTLEKLGIIHSGYRIRETALDNNIWCIYEIEEE